MRRGQRKAAAISTAIYIRLSREDGDKEESNSVSVQKRMLQDYVREKQELELYDIYVDDGYTGTNFERPAFRRMIEDVERGRIRCIVVKDLSRLGRDYIDTGYYVERFFPKQRVRFIAVNDRIDNAGDQEYDMLLPLRNIMNEQYARDISAKVQSAFKTRQRAGEFVGAFCSYGYRKAEQDKHKLEIDAEAAKTVREIYELYAAGCAKQRIAAILNERGVLCPAAYKREKGERYINGNQQGKKACWTYSTIHKMLNNEMYLGNMVQGKTRRRMKGKPMELMEEEWIKVEHTQEAIISQELWDKVRDRQSQQTKELRRKEEAGLFSGLLFCGDCGKGMYRKVDRGRYVYYRCGAYLAEGKKGCSPHNISEKKLLRILLEDMNSLLEKSMNGKAMQDEEKKPREVFAEARIDQINREMLLTVVEKIEVYADDRLRIYYTFSDDWGCWQEKDEMGEVSDRIPAPHAASKLTERTGFSVCTQ